MTTELAPPTTPEGASAAASSPSPPPSERPYHGGSVGLWAALGAIGVGLALEIWIRWIASSDFGAAPILGPDVYPTWNEVLLRVIEALSMVALVGLVAAVVVIPLRRRGHLGIEAKITLGVLIGTITEGVLDEHQYLFAWNAHSVNVGSWAGFMPFSTEHFGRYAESLLWGFPMYVYFCIGVAFAGCWGVRKLRARWPAISNARALFVVFLGAFVFDFVVENAIIRLSQAYGYAKVPGDFSVFDGTPYQFPLYESLFVGILGVVFTALRLSALEAPDGLSFAERGAHRFRAGLRGPLRWIAVIGFCMVCLFVIYHLPFNWLGMGGTSHADLPSYMLPGH